MVDVYWSLARVIAFVLTLFWKHFHGKGNLRSAVNWENFERHSGSNVGKPTLGHTETFDGYSVIIIVSYRSMACQILINERIFSNVKIYWTPIG